MSTLLLIAYCFSSLTAGRPAADPKYPVKEIGEQLKLNVNVVVREHRRTFTIMAKDRASYHVYKAITILNEQGKSFALEVVGYDELTKVKNFEGTVYDADGKLLKRLKNSEIYDQSAFDGVTLFSDHRLKAADLSHGSYPYTVEFEYELELKYLFQIPPFQLLSAEKMSVEHATYRLAYPEELKPKFLLINLDQQPLLENPGGGTETISWEFENILPIKSEPHGPARDNLYPRILSAPSHFEYADYEGSMNSWDDFGQWIESLNRGRDEIPENTKELLKRVTADLRTPEEKTRAVYHFLQERTRYVGIKLGIGGFQPFEASVVDEFGYGDCKALSNYMVAMLKAIGIKSHYALIHAGAEAAEMRPDFVSAQFNHVVVAVPNGADTLWLECTSQTNPFGYAGLFTGDRKALLITDTGAKIARTPRYTEKDNILSRNADVRVDETGHAMAKIKTQFRGLQYEYNNLDAVLENKYDDQKKWVLQNTQIPSFDLVSFAVSHQKEKIPSATIDMDLTLTRFASVSGKRVFLTPNLLSRNTYVPDPVTDRKSDVVRRIAYTNFDTIRYQVPENLYPEFMPADVSIKSRFGEYESGLKVEQGKLVYVRKVKMFKGVFPAESYAELIEFFRNISKADNAKIVLVSKT